MFSEDILKGVSQKVRNEHGDPFGRQINENPLILPKTGRHITFDMSARAQVNDWSLNVYLCCL